jgi:hypothetical protein
MKHHQTWVNIALFENEHDGQALAEFLKRNGFDSRVYYDKWLQMILFLAPPHAVYRAQVRALEYSQAAHFLDATPEAEPAVERAIHCPSCGSLRVNFPQMTRKFFIPTMMLHLGIIFRFIDHEAYCDACHYTWTLPKLEKSQAAKAPRPAH